MFPDVGATELLIIAAVALIVVGPKDLPVLLRKLGQFMAKMRGMANEFRASFDEMARQSELDELRREVQAMRSGQYLAPTEAATQASATDVDKMFRDIKQDLSSVYIDDVVAQPDDDPHAQAASVGVEARAEARAEAQARADTARTDEPAPKLPPESEH